MTPPTLICGDLFDVLKTLPADSFDACVTDSPYGIRFMGKAWDGKDIVAMANAQDKIKVGPGRSEKGRTTSGVTESMAAGKYDLGIAANRQFQQWTEGWAREIFRVLKPGAHLVNFGSPRTYHRMASGIEDAGFEIRDQLAWTFGSGFPKSMNCGAGRGTALKPAWEPICLARKPLIGTVAANLDEFSTGALNIDACRIPFASEADKAEAEEKNRHESFDESARDNHVYGKDERPRTNWTAVGRWPANLCHDGSDDVLACFPVSDSVGHHPAVRNGAGLFSGEGGGLNGNSGPELFTDSGSAARFFFCAKTSRAERDEGLEILAKVQRDLTRAAGAPGGDNPRNRGADPRANHHPTVKPIALMRWLVKLVTPPGGSVIEPFLGSGTTGIACVMDGHPFTGIEREEPYFNIARARIDHHRGSLFTHVQP